MKILIWSMTVFLEVPINSIPAKGAGSRSLVFSPDGSKLVSGNDNGEIFVWDADTFQEIGTHMKHGPALNSLSITPDGKTIVSASLSNATVKLWDIDTHEELGTINKADRAAAISPDGTKVAALHQNTLYIWDSKTLKLTYKAFKPRFFPISVVFTADGSAVIVGCSKSAKDGTIHFLELE